MNKWLSHDHSDWFVVRATNVFRATCYVTYHIWRRFTMIWETGERKRNKPTWNDFHDVDDAAWVLCSSQINGCRDNAQLVCGRRCRRDGDRLCPANRRTAHTASSGDGNRNRRRRHRAGGSGRQGTGEAHPRTAGRGSRRSRTGPVGWSGRRCGWIVILQHRYRLIVVPWARQ